MMKKDITFFGMSNARPPYRPVGIYTEDRFQHLYVVGKTGTGKTTLLENFLRQDISAGRGIILLDPDGDLAERVTKSMNEEDKKRLIYLHLGKAGRYGYNPLKTVAPHLIPLAASGILDTFRHHFGEKAWGHRMEHILRCTLYALLEYGKATLSDILRLLDDKDYRHEVLSYVENPQVLYYFRQEYDKLLPRARQEAIAPIQSKVGAYLVDPHLYKTLVDYEQEISLRRIMDTREMLIVNLCRGESGSDSAHLLGSLLVTTITLAALSRTSLLEKERVPCFLYLDEFEHFLTGSSAGMLSEVRKMKLSVMLAHQYLAQLPESLRSAVLGNVGTIISFRVGVEDAPLLAREFAPVFTATDFMHLPNHEMYMKLLIKGEVSRGFSVRQQSHW
jgi:hypothetical protein